MIGPQPPRGPALEPVTVIGPTPGGGYSFAGVDGNVYAGKPSVVGNHQPGDRLYAGFLDVKGRRDPFLLGGWADKVKRLPLYLPRVLRGLWSQGQGSAALDNLTTIALPRWQQTEEALASAYDLFYSSNSSRGLVVVDQEGQPARWAWLRWEENNLKLALIGVVSDTPEWDITLRTDAGTTWMGGLQAGSLFWDRSEARLVAIDRTMAYLVSPVGQVLASADLGIDLSQSSVGLGFIAKCWHRPADSMLRCWSRSGTSLVQRWELNPELLMPGYSIAETGGEPDGIIGVAYDGRCPIDISTAEMLIYTSAVSSSEQRLRISRVALANAIIGAVGELSLGPDVQPDSGHLAVWDAFHTANPTQEAGLAGEGYSPRGGPTVLWLYNGIAAHHSCDLDQIADATLGTYSVATPCSAEGSDPSEGGTSDFRYTVPVKIPGTGLAPDLQSFLLGHALLLPYPGGLTGAAWDLVEWPEGPYFESVDPVGGLHLDNENRCWAAVMVQEQWQLGSSKLIGQFRDSIRTVIVDDDAQYCESPGGNPGTRSVYAEEWSARWWTYMAPEIQFTAKTLLLRVDPEGNLSQVDISQRFALLWPNAPGDVTPEVSTGMRGTADNVCAVQSLLKDECRVVAIVRDCRDAVYPGVSGVDHEPYRCIDIYDADTMEWLGQHSHPDSTATWDDGGTTRRRWDHRHSGHRVVIRANPGQSSPWLMTMWEVRDVETDSIYLRQASLEWNGSGFDVAWTDVGAGGIQSIYDAGSSAQAEGRIAWANAAGIRLQPL